MKNNLHYYFTSTAYVIILKIYSNCKKSRKNIVKFQNMLKTFVEMRMSTKNGSALKKIL